MYRAISRQTKIKKNIRNWHATLFEKRLWYRYFPVNFAKFFRTAFFKKYLRRSASIKSLDFVYLDVIKLSKSLKKLKKDKKARSNNFNVRFKN